MKNYSLKNDLQAVSMLRPALLLRKKGFLAADPACFGIASAKSIMRIYPAAVLKPYGSVFFCVERYKGVA